MIDYKKYVLDNGLRVIVHPDSTTPMAAVNILYDVGARDEEPGRTGFAHLFEHLMFEGSVNVPRFDQNLQNAGGENNAFTTNDITNYYISLPAQNIETAFWLESDRMLGLSFSEEKLRTQKNVVIEEYRQSYLNQPYGDIWLLLRSLAYKVHPYQWATIGKNIDHIKEAELNDVKSFFSRYYHPLNAILSVAGDVDPERIFELAGKWFGDIPPGVTHKRGLPQEPAQTELRRKDAKRDVPLHQIYMAFHMCGRPHPDFHATDLISDILSGGESARLPARLVHDRKLFSEVNAFVTGNIDPGLLVVTGKPHNGVDIEKAGDMLWKEVSDIVHNAVEYRELEKVKNRVEATHTFSNSNILAKAMNLAYYELLGDASLYNSQIEAYSRVGQERIMEAAGRVIRKENMSLLNYGLV